VARTSTTTGAKTYNLGAVDHLALGEGRLFEIGPDALPVAVFRTRAGVVYATQGRCPHRGGPLADGITGGTTLVCPLHAYRFNLSSGKSLDNDCEALKTYPVAVSAEGDLLLTLETQP
jgi:nitrite reductase (NADH) small subunit